MWLLGGFRVSVGSRLVEGGRWRIRKAASLIKLLSLSPGHRMHREQIMDVLWPELGRQAAANNLRYNVHVARRVLEPDGAAGYLRLAGEELVLCPGGRLWVDVDAFKEAATVARCSREPAAYRAAIDLYAGELLPEDRYEEWTEGHREELRATFLALLLELARLYEERGEHAAAIEALRRVLSEEPAREEAHAGLMRLYARTGRRAEALRQYEMLRSTLRREFGVAPHEESTRLYREILSGRREPTGGAPEDRRPEEDTGTGPHNLPVPRDSFVGREREVAGIKRALSMTSLLTLTGTGGSGKTRLAVEVARDLLGAYPDGIWLVEFAPLSEPARVPQAVAVALGVREQPGQPLDDTLAGFLRARRTLLLLDNCEHLVDAVAGLVDKLLSSCPRLKMLATSREPLEVPGEVNWRVDPLSVPGAGSAPATGSLESYGAIKLFLDRARSRLPAFKLTPENAGAVAEACRKLDGLPLAIELAAARITALAVEQVAQRLEDSLKVLAGGSRTAAERQRTMRAALDWSYDLLEEPEKRLFRRLSVFAGGWTLEAAEAVGADGGGGGERAAEPPVLDLIFRLVSKSLITADAPPGGEPARYRMLEPVRQYAREKLEESGEAERVLERHAAFFLALAEEAESRLTGPDQEAWLDRLEMEHDNLRAVRRWAREAGKEEAGLRLAGALWRLWYTRGHLEEGRGWLEEALSGGDDTPSPARANALNGAGALAFQSGDPQRAERYFEQSLLVARALDDKPGMARALNNLASAANSQGRHERAKELLEQALALDRELGDVRGVAYSLGELGHTAFWNKDFVRAAEYLEESLALHRSLGDRRSIALTLSNLGTIARHTGQPQKAARLYGESLEAAREVGDSWLTTNILIEVGCFLAERDGDGWAASVLGAADRSRRELGFELEPHTLKDHEEAVRRLRTGLGERAFEAAWNQGRSMSLEEVVRRAIPQRRPKKTPAASGHAGLTRREREVVALLAQGMSNRRIAAELFVSEFTVATHIRNALKKLGLESRTQLAVWAATRLRADR